jgi:CTP synthase
LQEGTKAREAYAEQQVSERHRHRYEFNNKYRDTMKEKGLCCSGLYKDGDLVEIVELSGHPWFVACQFHPEFQSTPMRAHPLFRKFIEASCRQRGV